MNDTESLLSGVRIVELGHVLAAPLATSLCADFGAEVIKVEDPQQGDMMRSLGPDKDGVKLWWKVTGRNKKCVTLNLKHPRGLELCKQLIAQSDAVVENFRPGVLRKLGLGHEDMRAANPRLIIASVSGYGLTGPKAREPGHGSLADAYSGLMHLTGKADGPPLAPGTNTANITTATMVAFGLAMALFRRDARGGAPVSIDLGMHEALSRMIDWQIIAHDQLGRVPTRSGTRYPLGDAGLSTHCQDRDGKWLTVNGPPATMRKVLDVLGVGEDPRFRSDEDLRRNVDAFDAVLIEWVARHSRSEAVALMARTGAICGPIYDVADIFADAQYEARGTIATVADPELGAVKMVGVVPRIPEAPGAIRWTGPALGAHNQDVFGALLGLSAAELEALQREGAI